MATTFSLYGRSPTEASGQQMPWTSYFTEQNDLNERNRVASIIASLQLQEQQDRQDEYARRFDQGRAIELASYNRDLGERRIQQAESSRRFDVETGLRRERFGADLAVYEEGKADKLQNDILEGKYRSLAELESRVTPKNAGKIGQWWKQHLSDRVEGQLEQLRAQTAAIQAGKRAAEIKALRTGNPTATVSSEQLKLAMAIDPEEADLIARSIGKLEPGLRWDALAQDWTDKASPAAPLPVSSRNPVALPPNVLAAKSEMDAVLRSRQWDSGVAKGEAIDKYGTAFDDFRRNRNATLSPAPKPVSNMTATSDLVGVFNPSGQPVKIRRSQLTDALTKGYRLR